MNGAIIVFQGERGAYSEEAAIEHFGEGVDFKSCRTLRDVFEEVGHQRSQLGIVPVENSIEGTITQTYDLLLGTDLKIVGETVHLIRHSLLALPGVKLSDITVVYSHPQALAQCQNYLERLGLETIAWYDTAGAAKTIRERGLTNAAAIAGVRAAQIYDLRILATGIQDYPENFTRFFVIGIASPKPTDHDKTSMVFGVRHEPGMLFSALKEFADRRLNLTKIESRPIKGKPWEYYFYVDFEGHQNSDDVKELRAALETVTTYLKILGSYPQATPTKTQR
jgi:prephenate dehydratase